MLVAGTAHGANTSPLVVEPNDATRAVDPSAQTATEPAPRPLPTDGRLPPELSPKPAPPTLMSAQELEQRNRLLRAYVHGYVRGANFEEGFGYVYVALGVLGLAVGAASLRDDPAFGTAWTAGFGASTLAFGASLAASRDTRVDVLRATPKFVGGVIMLGFAVARDPYPLPRVTSVAASSTSFMLAAFDVANALARQTKLSTLRSERDRLDAGDVDTTELRAIEHDFLGSQVPLGPSIYAIPLGIGAAVSLVPAFDGHYSQAERTWSAVIGSTLGLTCVLSLLSVQPVSHYSAQLNSLGFELVASPTNLGFRYRF
jgi:hypothetical protein